MMTQHFEHPLWATQVALERGMLREGAARVQDQATQAVAKHQRSKLKPFQDLMQAWLPPIAKDLQAWVKQMDTPRRGPVPMALEPLQQADLYVVALLGLRTILDGVTVKHQAITALSDRIGGDIEHELQVALWEAQEPDLYYAQQKKLKAQHADSTHTRRVNINRFNDLLKSGKSATMAWDKWGQIKRIAVGSVVINSIIRATGWFELHEIGEKTMANAPLTLVLKPGMEEWVAERLAKLEECSPALKPTVIPPKRWTGMHDGGYWTPYVQGPDLIRFHAHQLDQRSNAADEVDAIDMPQVYSALHVLQETPWRINARVHSVMQEALKRQMVIAGIPNYRGQDLPPRPHDMDTNAEANSRWRREASEIRKVNAMRGAKRKTFDRIMGIACEYQNFERFYFPHMLDFRGRMYPIPIALQPQGNDVAKSLLEFADGRPVDEDNGGVEWLAINLASAWGNDKISFQERADWVFANEAKWRLIASDPFKYDLSWIEASKPWQALAAIFDWVACLDYGYGYVSHAAVAVDGTCNGIQHLSAMTRDAIAGAQVNMTPGDKPRDIYTYVGDSMIPELRRIAFATKANDDTIGPIQPGMHPSELATFWLGFLSEEGHLPRTFTKRPVMVLPYGASREAFFKYIKEALDEAQPMVEPKGDDAKLVWTLRYKRVSFLTKLMWDAVTDALPGAIAVMQWLRDCAKHAAVGDQPIYWITPDGFVCRHFYGKMKVKRVNVKLDGSAFHLRVWEPTKELDIERQLRGISPNFTHSLDGCAARLCINMAAEQSGITHFASIHDSFATHAANLWALAGHTRQAFVATHTESVLVNFREACKSVMVGEMVASKGIDPLEASELADEQLPRVLPMGELVLEDVLESDYFFA